MAEIKERLTTRQIALQKSNKAFERSSKIKKRLMVLEDALKISRLQKFRIEQGSYGHFHYVNTSLSTQENLLKSNEDIVCRVCAKGALFCSRVRLGNNVDLNLMWGVGEEDTINALDGIFTKTELDIFEDVFENYSTYSGHLSSSFSAKLQKNGYRTNAEDYIKRYYPKEADKRFVKMVKNVIWANGNVEKGLFRYLDKPKKIK